MCPLDRVFVIYVADHCPYLAGYAATGRYAMNISQPPAVLTPLIEDLLRGRADSLGGKAIQPGPSRHSDW